MQYNKETMVLLARRENNSMRPYLFVNPLQGKHIPTSPEDAIGMCQALAEKINDAYPDELLYVIGFAETATGIAACVTGFLNNAVYYQNTTREANGKDCIVFSEVHSHAKDQLLRTDGVGEAVKKAGRILFIDDEVTTGNTILNLAGMIRERFRAEGLRFTIVSLLNSMSGERFAELERMGIECLYLERIPHGYRTDSILDVPFDPARHAEARGTEAAAGAGNVFICPVNPRYPVRFRDYRTAVREFAEEIRTELLNGRGRPDRVLVLGTEEFMYPTFVTGEMIRQQGLAREVRIHSTTRSPIIACGREGYPLYFRYQIRSPYDPERKTYVYNLREYDRVFVLTDAGERPAGLGDLRRALETAGNKDITVIRWQYPENGEGI